ncbi:MalY/PatB family protein [Parapedobacter sp. 10938]|uniref:MalY/PatB family protein n=1 Tax=Parapedobacter flavus TaxID=3110225 RepID=UPI002DB95DB7|nr:MalY/PatB family protein [Parapedobacter sp. 10938]MEC3879983.1 MalY/PatB family protein [Parapedobacter sp. 10938]
MDNHFDEYIDRTGTDSIKWDAAASDVLPMWIADMDFKAAPAIQAALQKRVAHGVFGYTLTPDRFFDAIIGWWQKRHGYALQKEWIRPVTGVIPALSAIVRALTAPGDKVLVQPPVYNHFYVAIAHTDRQVIENKLLFKEGAFHIDFADLEEKAADPSVKLLMLCNPHNPAGRVWTAKELLQIGEICARHGVVVLSDEIHSDLVYHGHTHIPFASLANTKGLRSVTVCSPSKTFNLAGLQVGYLFSENPDLMKRIEQVLMAQEMELLSPFAIEALIAAYEHGEDWLESLIVYLKGNFDYVTDFCSKHLPQINVVPLEATYLVWLDCRAILTSSADFAAKLVRQEKVWLNPGTLYGDAGEGFLRMNIACPRSLLEEGLARFAKGIAAG